MSKIVRIELKGKKLLMEILLEKEMTEGEKEITPEFIAGLFGGVKSENDKKNDEKEVNR